VQSIYEEIKDILVTLKWRIYWSWWRMSRRCISIYTCRLFFLQLFCNQASDCEDESETHGRWILLSFLVPCETKLNLSQSYTSDFREVVGDFSNETDLRLFRSELFVTCSTLNSGGTGACWDYVYTMFRNMGAFGGPISAFFAFLFWNYCLW
jgi:hypothetical protein